LELNYLIAKVNHLFSKENPHLLEGVGNLLKLFFPTLPKHQYAIPCFLNAHTFYVLRFWGAYVRVRAGTEFKVYWILCFPSRRFSKV